MAMPNTAVDGSHAPDADRIAALSSELAFRVDATGRITWADARAARLAGLNAGTALATVAVPGSADKLQRFLAAARREMVEGWEFIVTTPDGPVTLAARGAPDEQGGVLVVASRIPTDYGMLLGRMSDALGELASLHRETEQQRLELSDKRDALVLAGRTIAERDSSLTAASTDLSEATSGLRVLYGELDEKESSLRRVLEVKARFVANVSHELRTPLNSILGLARLLLSKQDGELTMEQERQLGYIRRSAETLSELVNDLLDLAKLEAGKIAVRPTVFTATDLMGSLRGMLRPLATSERVALHFDPPADDLPVFESDEAKVAQVLRNLVSNALKFTREGEVRVSMRPAPQGMVDFSVRDTGIGIAPHDQERIFEEFAQVEHPLQKEVKGTGLGLSLSRRMAEALGGTLMVQSAPGKGSTFTLRIPAVHPESAEMAELAERGRTLDPTRSPVLVVEDDRQTLFLYEKYLEGSGFQVIPARTIDDAREHLTRFTPAAIVLDVILEGEATWSFLSELKKDERTRDIPALVVTVTDREQKARALGADEFYVKPIERDWLLGRLKTLAKTGPMQKVLVIDDDEVARYLVRKLLANTEYSVIEASDGPEGIRRAREDAPHLIILDFVMPEMTAFEVLDELKCDPRTRGIPVVVSTSKSLSEQERARLQEETAAILSKQSLSREIAIGRIREALAKAIGG